MYTVYWIHLPEHIDMFTQGYIGVTSRHPSDRLYEHISTKNTHLSNAFIKYGNKMIQTTILVGLEDYCYEIEYRLRPSDHIGWNIVKGGGCPPSWKGIEKTAEHRANISKAKKAAGYKHSAETLAKIQAKRSNYKVTDEHKANVSKALKGRSYEDLYGDRADEMRAKRTGRPPNAKKV